MPATKYKCVNFAVCSRALERETIEVDEGEEPLCPECGLRLEPLNRNRTGGKPLWLMPAAAVLLVASSLVFVIAHSRSVPNKQPYSQVASGKITSAPPSEKTESVPPPDPCRDAQLEATLRESLQDGRIEVNVADQTVTLSGTVETRAEIAGAIQAVRGSGCPVTLLNRLTIAPLPSPSPAIPPVVKEPVRATPPIVKEPAPATSPVVKEPAPAPPGNLTGTWSGTLQTCAQGQTPVRMTILERAPDDITSDVEIIMPIDAPGTFTAHAVINTLNGFLTLQFGGWQHQPSGLSMGNIGGYITYPDPKTLAYSGIIRPPGCGRFSLQKD